MDIKSMLKCLVVILSIQLQSLKGAAAPSTPEQKPISSAPSTVTPEDLETQMDISEDTSTPSSPVELNYFADLWITDFGLEKLSIDAKSELAAIIDSLLKSVLYNNQESYDEIMKNIPEQYLDAIESLPIADTPLIKTIINKLKS